ncbi:MAG: hypothetical protein ACPG4X_12840, partial [Pikeienuella sp.]
MRTSEPDAANVRKEPILTDAALRTNVRFGAAGEITLEIPAHCGRPRPTSDIAPAFPFPAVRCEREGAGS